jgi:hypothetical protein
MWLEVYRKVSNFLAPVDSIYNIHFLIYATSFKFSENTYVLVSYFL